MITVSLVEDHKNTRHSLAALLKNAPDVDCVSIHPTGEDALREIPFHKPRVVLMDINLPGMSGIECVEQLKEKLPGTEILMLTAYEDTDRIFASLKAGASGYLLKSAPTEEIVTAIRDITQGDAPMSASIARKVVRYFHNLQAADSGIETLTLREHEILRLLSKGYHYKEIASQLGISTGTVRTHLHIIYRKLQVQSRTEAVVKYLNR
jgi:DNA-binding NarL/FixJ family response regulator